MHRFIPIYVSWQGGRVTEMPVSHRPRLAGQSKYGLERVMKVMLDLIVVQFLGRYETKPIYVFGGFGLLSMALAVAAGLQAVYYKLMGLKDFVETPLPLIAVMAMITGVMSILMGLLAEILVRTYYEAQQKSPYDVRETLNIDQH
jgi:dolichol-phosphate mannosyltransferase